MGVFARTWGMPQPDGTVDIPLHVTEGSTINGREQFVQTRASAEHAPMFMRREREMLSKAETIYVSEEIVDRITYAAAEMDPEPLFHTDMFAPYGLMVLEKPLFIPDYHPQSGEMTDYLHVAMRALGWAPEPEIHSNVDGEMKAVPGIMMFSYTTNQDWRDSYETEVYRAIRQGLVDPKASGLTWPDGTLAEQGSARFMMSHGLSSNLLLPMDVMPWSFGRDWTHKPKAVYEPGVVDSAVAYVRRWMLTLMRFTWQKLLIPERPEFSKKLARTAREYNKPNLQWSVLRIRRTAARSEPTGTGHKLMYRVRTRGYWKNVYYSSLGPDHLEDGTSNPDSHRLKWIDAHWRGPLDGPVGPLHKATVITR